MSANVQFRRVTVELPETAHWVHRRARLLHHGLPLVIALLPQRVSGRRPEITACPQRLTPMRYARIG